MAHCAKGGKARTPVTPESKPPPPAPQSPQSPPAECAAPATPPAIHSHRTAPLLPEPIRPSGPIAISSSGISASAALTASSTAPRSVVDRSCSASTSRAAFDSALHAIRQLHRIMDRPAHPIAATAAQPRARCVAIAPRASSRPSARCFSVRRAITGAIAATPNSVAFSIAHSM